MKLSYKSKFLFFHFLSVFILTSTIYIYDSISNKSNINNISYNNFKTVFNQKEQYILNLLNSYKNALNVLSKSEPFKNYINNSEDVKNSNHIFLSLIDTLPAVFQIRYIDLEGNEKIKIDKNLFSKDIPSIITPKNQLENKSNRNYFKTFIALEKGVFGISDIDLNSNNGKISEPKMATTRIAKTIFDKDNNKKGFIVLNVLLDELFKYLSNDELFKIYLVNNKGNIIFPNNEKMGIYSKNFDTYLLDSHFKKLDIKSILSNDEFMSEKYYSKKIKNFNSGEDITLFFESKYNFLEKDLISQKTQLIFALIIISILALPLVLYFAGTPERLEEKIIKQFITDDLTKLPNLEHLLNDLKEKEFKNSLIILLNITNDKNIQNIYGFNVSKELLKECAKFFTEYKKIDPRFLKVYKIKHNVFAFKYLYKDRPTLNKSLNKLQNLLENKEFIILDKYEITIDTAIGVSGIDTLNNDINELKEAEIALDDAIESNHDISIYNNSHIENIEKYKANIDKIKVIKDAILNNNVLIAFQPIYNNFQGKVEKYEVLVRLKYKDKIFYPDEFLQISKRIKKYKALTKIIIQKTFEYFADKDFEFSINLSMEDIIDEEIRQYLYEEIVNNNVQNKLVIELVETEAINNYEAFTNFIKQIKKLNCKIAIDDFGSGYSNYDYIIKLSDYIDYLKIDGTLITDIDTNKKTQLLVGTLKFLCDSLKIRTIAEYVENKEIFEFIKAMNISYSQGYYIGKPEFELTVNENIEEGKKNLNYF
ncbi:EAL domain-containing protein [Arcobacter sp.]|uniref:bifunctional diguanylate cyclase/phosphodiesterase n=1 Tax=Arcobacter sp. TaxID=1872629 RepID=UPI003D1231A5